MAKPESFRLKSKNYAWVFLFFAGYLVFCLGTFRDYSITWDETDCYDGGEAYLNYYLKPWLGDDMQTVTDAAHNYFYPAVLRLFCWNLNFEGLHLLNLFFGLTIFAAFYFVFAWAHKSRGWALTACLFLALTPRFLGDLPANPKDMPFAIFYFLSLAAIYLVPQKIKGAGLQAFWIGSLIGVTSTVRILGLTLFPVLALYRFFVYLRGWGPDKGQRLGEWLRKEALQYLLILAFSQFWMLSLWPYLENHFPGGYLSIFKVSRDFSWDNPILFMGRLIHPTDRLWYYLPIWIGISIPLFILVFFLGSIFICLRSKEERPWSLFILFSTAFWLNMAVYLALKPILYNGLRHYLFVVPLICGMAALGFTQFFRGRRWNWIRFSAASLTVLNVILVLIQLARLYPCFYIYFNETVGGLKGAYGRFETDYWGAGSKEAVQWLMANGIKNPAKRYCVHTAGFNTMQAYYFRPNVQGALNMKDPDYEIALTGSTVFEPDKDSHKTVLHVVEREGVPLAYVLAPSK